MSIPGPDDLKRLVQLSQMIAAKHREELEGWKKIRS